MFRYYSLMAHSMFRPRRTSLTPAPDYSAKQQVKEMLSKKSKEETDYKPASMGSEKRCHECANYMKPGQSESDCRKVIDIVVADGVCDLWQQRDYSEKKTNTEIVISVNGNS